MAKIPKKLSQTSRLLQKIPNIVSDKYCWKSPTIWRKITGYLYRHFSQQCAVFLDRFSNVLFQLPNATLKCFNPVPIEPYVKYMSNFLQAKRFTADYVHRATNAPRDRPNECLLKKAALMKFVKDSLIEKYDYYKFCHSCVGTPSDLLFEQLFPWLKRRIRATWAANVKKIQTTKKNRGSDVV